MGYSPEQENTLDLPAPPVRLVGLPAFSRTLSLAREKAAHNKPLICLLIVESIMLLSLLNNTSFWIDESINGMLGRNILTYGYPNKWDGTYLVESYFDTEAARGVVEITHSWLQYYVTAAALAMFGQSTVAARLPFVFFGILSVAALYFLSRRLSGCDRLAILASILLAFHTGFLVYSRLCRYFSLAFLFSILTLLTYLKWADRPTRRNLALFTICSVLLFHSHYPIWPFILFTIGVYFLSFDRRRHPGKDLLKPFAVSCSIMVALILPWVVYAQPYGHNIPDWSGASHTDRIAMFAWKVNTWVFPFFGLLLIVGLVKALSAVRIIKRRLDTVRPRREYLLLLCIPLYLVLITFAKHPMFSSQYTAHAIPFAAVTGAYLILWVREHSRVIASVTLALLVATNALHILPFVLIDKLGVNPRSVEGFVVNPRAQFNSGTPLAHFIYDQLGLRSQIFEYAYFATHPYDHRLKALTDYLKGHATPDQTILVPWHDADAIRFYTNMKVVYHFKPSFTVQSVKALVYQPGIKLDWIVPNAFYEPDQPFFKYDREEYERVYIGSPKDYIYENEPNLDFFMWRTNSNAPKEFFILKRKELTSEVEASRGGPLSSATHAKAEDKEDLGL
jgi:hypothetical protein